MRIAYPYGFDSRRRTAVTDTERHVRDLIEQVLFTRPGERVNRPDFGCGLAELLFTGNSEALATAAQFTVQAALQRWLGEIIAVEEVAVEAEDAILRVLVVYSLRRTGERRTETFERTEGA